MGGFSSFDHLHGRAYSSLYIRSKYNIFPFITSQYTQVIDVIDGLGYQNI